MAQTDGEKRDLIGFPSSVSNPMYLHFSDYDLQLCRTTMERQSLLHVLTLSNSLAL
jgi:hypothetical protein